MTTSLDTRSKDTIVSTIAAGMQGRTSSVFLNFAKGKIFRALAEAYAGVCLWLQKDFITVLALTRASTSAGSDLDTWVADYGLTRLPSTAATGLVTFSRYTAASAAAVVPVGATVQTNDGSLRFTVYADPTNGAYSAAAGGYVLLPGAASVIAPVACTVSGTTGNIAAGAIALVASSIPGVDTVGNAAAFSNGIDAEADIDLRARFVLYINSLATANPTALGAAITGLAQGLRYQIVENVTPDGQPQIGYVTIYVDDGSGNPSSSLVQAAAVAVNAKRAAGVQTAVIGAAVCPAVVSLTIEIDPSYRQQDVVATVTAALSVYINGLALGDKLRFTRLEQISYDASPGVTNVTNVALNGGAADLVPAIGQTIKATALSVQPAA